MACGDGHLFMLRSFYLQAFNGHPHIINMSKIQPKPTTTIYSKNTCGWWCPDCTKNRGCRIVGQTDDSILITSAGCDHLVDHAIPKEQVNNIEDLKIK